MSCCDESTARVPDGDVSRRAVFKGAALIASVIPAARPVPSSAEAKRVKLGYCSQLLCGVPYEIARSAGLFERHGLDVELVYTRGGNAAMQALIGGAVDYGASALDVAIQAYADVRADMQRGRLASFQTLEWHPVDQPAARRITQFVRISQEVVERFYNPSSECGQCLLWV